MLTPYILRFLIVAALSSVSCAPKAGQAPSEYEHLSTSEVTIDPEGFSFLVTVFKTTGGASWKFPQGSVPWNISDPSSVCRWAGIACDPTGYYVTEVGLDGFGLTGTLPFPLSLPFLYVLSLDQNYWVNGTVDLSGFPQLLRFSASQTSNLVGPVNCPESLNEIDISYSRLALPLNATLPNVKSLRLSASWTRRLPPLTAFPSLVSLWADRLALTGPLPGKFPPGFLRLILDHNSLEGPIPASFVSLTGGWDHRGVSFSNNGGVNGTIPVAMCTASGNFFCDAQGTMVTCPQGYKGYCCGIYCPGN